MPFDFTGLFTPSVLAENWVKNPNRTINDYIGTGLFPARKKAGLDLSWIKGSKGTPISLMPSAFDAKATFRDRIGVNKVEIEMPFFREGFKIKEKDRQEMLRAQDTNDPYAQQVIQNVFDDTSELLMGAHVVAERMRMQLLFPIGGDVGIHIEANGVKYTYNYDTDGSWKTNNYIALTGSDLWTASTTADPFTVFDQAKDAVSEKSGAELKTAIMSKATFNMLCKLDAVKNRLLLANNRVGSIGYLTQDEVKNVIRSTSGLDIVVWNKSYRDESKNTHKFIPDGYVALVPDGAIGQTFYGTTPEEADLRGSRAADVSIVDTGVAITRIVEPHPVNVDIFASQIVLPSYERMDEVAVIKVA